MAKEYESTCQSCGCQWVYNDADLRENKRLKEQTRSRGVVSMIGALRGESVNSYVQTKSMLNTGRHIVDYGRCPRCGSMDVHTTATHVDNWLLDDPSSPLFAGAADGQSQEYHGAKSKTLAGILAILLGWTGAHKFYLGYMTEGGIMLAISVLVGMFIPLISALVMAILGTIEGIVYLTKNDEAFNRTYVMGHKGWL